MVNILLFLFTYYYITKYANIYKVLNTFKRIIKDHIVDNKYYGSILNYSKEEMNFDKISQIKNKKNSF